MRKTKEITPKKCLCTVTMGTILRASDELGLIPPIQVPIDSYVKFRHFDSVFLLPVFVNSVEQFQIIF